MEIALVSFSDRALANAIDGHLAQHGYVPRRIAFDAWLVASASILRMPTVLAFDSDKFPRARLIGALSEVQRTASLGVFSASGGLADRELLQSLTDFVSWPCSSDELTLRLNRVCPRNERKIAGSPLSTTDLARLNLIGRSPKFTAALRLIERVADCDAPVIIEGETGTGKEAAARAIHYASVRRSFPFVPINCGAIPDNLIESELFGHERGAFTDAKETRQGVIAQAEGGTIFLDEVDALSAKGQVTLLRFLQDRQYRPLGSGRVRTADARIVAATNAKLSEQVSQGRFRADLMYRLNILSLQLPPLRERTGDVALLARYFVARLSARYRRSETAIDENLLAWLEAQPWPGNVRELESYLHRKLLMSEPGAPIAQESPVDSALSDADSSSLFRAEKKQLICEFERSILSKALSEHSGNVTRAAKHVGKERRAFGKLLKKHNIAVDAFRRPAFE